MKASRDLSWRQKIVNRHLPDDVRKRFVSKPKIGHVKRRYVFHHGPWRGLLKLLLLAAILFYFLGSIPAAIFWTFLVDNPKFTYRERTMVILRIESLGRRGTGRTPLYIRRMAYGLIDGKREEIGLPPKLDYLKVGDSVKVAYCPDRLEGTFCGWFFRVLPMSSFENRKAYARNFLYAVWGPLALIVGVYLTKKIIDTTRRTKCEESEVRW